MKSRPLCLPLLAALSVGLAAPAMAQPGLPPVPPQGVPMPAADGAGEYYSNAAPDRRPEWKGGYDQGGYELARADWLNECRRNHSHGKTVGGAVLGGLVGGVIGRGRG